MNALKETKRQFKEGEIGKDLERTEYSIFLSTLYNNCKTYKDNLSKDLWYFSDNTDFCRKSAKFYLNEICLLMKECKFFFMYREQKEQSKKFYFNIDANRRVFGCLCFYLYNSLESFAHEINLFYELNCDRKCVSLKYVTKKLKKINSNSSLSEHLEQKLSHQDIEKFYTYRNAVMHGYVFPTSIRQDGVYLKPNPQDGPFSFDDIDMKLENFCNTIYSEINHLICNGWRCFERDELRLAT